MQVINRRFTVQKIKGLKAKINPKPQYQRGQVWSAAAQRLLIDSILCGFDIPKLYLHKVDGSAMYDFEVTDGQQRLRAIWDFLDDIYSLGDTSYLANAPWIGCKFSDLKAAQKKKILSFKIVAAVVSKATPDEIRELFARLQKGVRLTPPELRNCIPSQLGDCIRAMAVTHPFFSPDTCAFQQGRFTYDDLCAHAFAVVLYDGQDDMKAPLLKTMYERYANTVPASAPKRVTTALQYLHEVQSASPQLIRTKWGFVDLCSIALKDKNALPEPDVLARRYQAFEMRRKAHLAKPDRLLTDDPVSPKDRRLYDYIIAFRTSGGLVANVKRRYAVLKQELLR
jgi:hypothetical protein